MYLINKSSDAIPFFQVFSTGSVQLPSSGSTTIAGTLAIDSTFELYGFETWSSLDAATDASPANNFNIKMKDLTNGRDFMTDFIPRVLFGAFNSFFTAEGRRVIFPRQNQFQFDLVDASGGHAQDVIIVMKGYKLYNNIEDLMVATQS